MQDTTGGALRGDVILSGQGKEHRTPDQEQPTPARSGGTVSKPPLATPAARLRRKSAGLLLGGGASARGGRDPQRREQPISSTMTAAAPAVPAGPRARYAGRRSAVLAGEEFVERDQNAFLAVSGAPPQLDTVGRA